MGELHTIRKERRGRRRFHVNASGQQQRDGLDETQV
jgi:hypothetical protein